MLTCLSTVMPSGLVCVTKFGFVPTTFGLGFVIHSFLPTPHRKVLSKKRSVANELLKKWGFSISVYNILIMKLKWAFLFSLDPPQTLQNHENLSASFISQELFPHSKYWATEEQWHTLTPMMQTWPKQKRGGIFKRHTREAKYIYQLLWRSTCTSLVLLQSDSPPNL